MSLISMLQKQIKDKLGAELSMEECFKLRMAARAMDSGAQIAASGVHPGLSFAMIAKHLEPVREICNKHNLQARVVDDNDVDMQCDLYLGRKGMERDRIHEDGVYCNPHFDDLDDEVDQH